MPFMKKMETIPFSEFMQGDWKQKAKDRKKEQMNMAITKMSMAGVVATAIGSGSSAHASMMGDMIIKACDPIIDLLQGVSYPVAFIMITGGFLLIMTGQTSRGMHFIKWACLGYLGLQFAPALMKIVITIGSNISSQVQVGMP
jgi:cyanophycinase-like exopeptidase